MNDWLWHHLGIGPDQRFYEWDLLMNCPDFEALRAQGLLTRDLEAEKSDFLITRWGRCLDLVRFDGLIFGVDTEDREDPYVEVDPRELIQYRFNWEPWLRKVREVNGLDGVSSWLHPRLAFLGEKIDAGRKFSFVLGFFNHRDVAMDLLLSLPARTPRGYDAVVVTTLAFGRLPQEDIANLERLQVYVVPPINPETLEIDTAHLTPREQPPVPVALCSKQEEERRHYGHKSGLPIVIAGVTDSRAALIPVTTLTAEQKRDYQLYGYRCSLPIHITGEIAKSGNNIVLVGSTAVEIGDTPFLLFLRLILELRRNNLGAVSKVQLKSEGYLSEDTEFQQIRRLRECFVRALAGLEPKDFIEGYRPKTLRVSVHPALVSWDEQKLLAHDDSRVRELVEQLLQLGKANAPLTS